MKRLLTISMLLLASVASAAEESRNYHPVDLAKLASDNPAHWHFARTHVKVAGWVAYMKQEADGDLHVRLCDTNEFKGKPMDRAHCIVVEFIPELRRVKGFIVPNIGDHIEVRGITRYDAEVPNHSWWEVHPAESFEKTN